MAKNPLFTEGLYFFSNLYDDSLLSDFYPKITREIWSSSYDSQKSIGTRGIRTSGDFNFYKGSISDFIVDDSFNKRFGFNSGTWSMKLPGFSLPIWNEKVFYRTYLSDNRQYVKVPQQDFVSNQKIFSRAISIQFGELYFMTATFIMSMDHTVYLVLPFKSNSAIKDENYWSETDYYVLSAYIADHADDEDDLYTAIWIIPTDRELTLKISPTLGKNPRNPIQTAEIINYFNQRRYSFKIDSTDPNISFIGDIRYYEELIKEDADSWDLFVYNRNFGNTYYHVIADPQTNALWVDGEGNFGCYIHTYVTDYTTLTLGIGSNDPNACYYSYLIKRRNRRNVITDPSSMVQNLFRVNNSITDTLVKDIVPSAYNISVYAYDTTRKTRTVRLDSFNLEPEEVPGVYDFTDISPNSLPLRIEVTDYTGTITKQRFHNSIHRIGVSLYGSSYATVVDRGADIIEAGDPSFLQSYRPTAQNVSASDYLSSDYVGDFRGYYLDKILKTMETDPMLNLEYLKFMESVDPIVVTVVGTPKTIGFNINDKTIKNDNFKGTNPIVYNTKNYRYNELEEIIYFDEPHSFISIYSNHEYVDAEVYVRGIHFTPTCQTFKDGVNYLFFPCAAIAKEILKFKNVQAQLLTARPILIDIYPHSYPREVGSPKESRTVRLNQKYSLSFGGRAHRTIRPIDLYFYPNGSKTLQPNFFDHFDIELTLNRFTLDINSATLIDTETLLPFDSQDPTGTVIGDGRYAYDFCLRKDQSLDSFLPIIHHIWPGASVKPSGEKTISLREAIAELEASYLLEHRDAYRLMCRSLPLEDIKLKLIDESLNGTSVTIGLRNFGRSIKFEGGVIVDDEFGAPFDTEDPSVEGDACLLEYELNSVYWQDDNLGAFEVDVYDFLTDPLNEREDGSIPWLLFRNGRYDPTSMFNLQSNQLGATVHISSNLLGSTEYPGSDVFEIVHIPYSFKYNLLEISKSMRYMEYGHYSGTTIDTVWPNFDYTNYIPYNNSVLFVDTEDDDDSLRLGGPGTMVFSDIGCRLGIPLYDTETERAVYYKGYSDIAVTVSANDNSFVLKHPVGLGITHGMNLSHHTINKLIMRPHKKEIRRMRVFGDFDEQNPSARLRSVIMQDEGFKILGKMKWPSRIQRTSFGPSWSEIGISDAKINIFAYVNRDEFYAIGNSDVYLSSDGGLTWGLSSLRELPFEANWSSLAYGKKETTGEAVTIVINSDNNTYAVSRNGEFPWREFQITVNPDFDMTGWSQLAYGNGIFVALSDSHSYAARALIEDVDVTGDFMWTLTEIENHPVETWGGLVYTGKGFLAVNQSGTRAYFSTDGISWSTSDPRSALNRMDYLHGGFNGGSTGVFSGGIGALPIRAAKKSSGNGWGIEFNSGDMMEQFLIDSEGYVDMEKSSYPSPYLNGDDESILITYLRDYYRSEE